MEGGEQIALVRCYPEAQEALLAHFGEECEVRLVAAVPGYFMLAGAAHFQRASLPASQPVG